jgi:hypothetical protein
MLSGSRCYSSHFINSTKNSRLELSFGDEKCSLGAVTEVEISLVCKMTTQLFFQQRSL